MLCQKEGDSDAEAALLGWRVAPNAAASTPRHPEFFAIITTDSHMMPTSRAGLCQ